MAGTKPADQQKSRVYQIDIDFENLPDQEEELVVYGEESLLQTAFQNLMENGCKYSPTQSVSVRLSFERGWVAATFQRPGLWYFREGPPHIFEPFYRSESTMTIKGHGIGLALTQRIIELHRGQIKVESTPGKGTTFFITLPIPYRSSAAAETTKLAEAGIKSELS